MQLLSQSRPPPPTANFDTLSPDPLQGVFKTREELDSYEKLWHTQVYQPTWDEQATKVKPSSRGGAMDGVMTTD